MESASYPPYVSSAVRPIAESSVIVPLEVSIGDIFVVYGIVVDVRIGNRGISVDGQR